jgi:single-stranded-DNA-specific exonuclease
MTDDISRVYTDAVSLVKSLPTSTKIRVVSHYDADGISAAGILCTALYNQGYDFHASLMRNPFDKGFKRLAEEQNELIIFSDMGSGQIETIEKLNTKVIILDHHQFIRPSKTNDIIQINANALGINGNYEACGATLSYRFATTLNTENKILAPIALAGAIGDKQHIGGIKGFNQQILETALKDKLLTTRIGSKLYGKNIYDALYYSIDPFYKNLSGNDPEIKRLLKLLSLPEDTSLDSLSEDTVKKINSLLLIQLLEAEVQPTIIDIVFRTRYYAPILHCELERFADLLDACGKNDARSLGLSICLGNTKDITEAEKIEKDYKTKILQELQKLATDTYEHTTAFHYFYSESSSLGGVVAGIAINYVVDNSKPLFSLTRKDHEIHISCRGTQPLVTQGLDLGHAMKTVATELNGFGGGHKIAAGATIAADKEQEFISKVTTIINNQVKPTP